MEITKEALEQLDKLSLVSYVTIRNSFTGLYMTRQLRVWNCEAEIRIGSHRVSFDSYDRRLPSDINVAISALYQKVRDYVKSHPDLCDYWDSDD